MIIDFKEMFELTLADVTKNSENHEEKRELL